MALIEKEFRKKFLVSSWFEAISYLPPHAKRVDITYFKSFRIKSQTCELKWKEDIFAVYRDGKWFEYVTSKELAYEKWSRKTHALFFLELAFGTACYENRLEYEISPEAKIYAYSKNGKYGVCFECESETDLEKYRSFYSKFPTNLPPRTGGNNSFPTRKQVKPTNRVPLSDHVKSIKYDGIYGFVHFNHNGTLVERWEDNTAKSTEQFYDEDLLGFTFAAEKLSNGKVILLDVLQVNGLPVKNCTKEILLEYLPSIRKKVPYSIQKYYTDDSTLLPKISDDTDGIIFHCFNDEIYKLKGMETIDLLYTDNKLQCLPDQFSNVVVNFNLENGKVYECACTENNTLHVLKERPDRLVGNSDIQIKNSLKCLNRDR